MVTVGSTRTSARILLSRLMRTAGSWRVTTIGTNTQDHPALLSWAAQFAGDGEQLLWAVGDCRHLSRRLKRDLLGAGQAIVRFPPKLMARVRDSVRTYGKSYQIDAPAEAGAARREPDRAVARLDGRDRDIRLLTDHRNIPLSLTAAKILGETAGVVPCRTHLLRRQRIT